MYEYGRGVVANPIIASRWRRAAILGIDPNPKLAANIEDCFGERSVSAAGREVRGGIVVSVSPDGGGARAGLLHGDVIVHVDVARTVDATDVVTSSRITPLPFKIGVFRKGKFLTLDVR